MGGKMTFFFFMDLTFNPIDGFIMWIYFELTNNVEHNIKTPI